MISTKMSSRMGRPPEYLFDALLVGQCIIVPFADEELRETRWGLTYRRVKGACDKYRARRAPEKRFRIDVIEHRVMVTRLPDRTKMEDLI